MKRLSWREYKWMLMFITLNTFAVAVVYELGVVPGVALMLATTPLAHKMFPEY